MAALQSTLLRAFEQQYDISHQELAFQARGDFLRAFPKRSLSGITIGQYVIGHKRPTFCDYVEAKTKAWANIQGSTAFKFGIYYGKTRSDPNRIYRFTNKFGQTRRAAFTAIKAALLDLLALGGRKNPDFHAIDANPLSQLLKAKILSLYYPNQFLNVCSGEHLASLGIELGFREDLPISQYQHILLVAKNRHAITRRWSNPKFMSFLYSTYVRTDKETSTRIRRVHTKSHPKVNFEDIQNQRNEIGKIAEDYAWKWEIDRLNGAGLNHLISQMEDKRDRPGYGYDFLSYSSKMGPRFIEVKSAGKDPKNGKYRFFLSDTEHTVSWSKEHRHAYFFYLVFFDKNRKPRELYPVLAEDLYARADISTAAYTVRFDTR